MSFLDTCDFMNSRCRSPGTNKLLTFMFFSEIGVEDVTVKYFAFL